MTGTRNTLPSENTFKVDSNVDYIYSTAQLSYNSTDVNVIHHSFSQWDSYQYFFHCHYNLSTLRNFVR